LIGEVAPVPNKNAMLAVLPACILTDETVVYKNLAPTTDVQKTLKILELLGAEIDQSDWSQIKINCKSLKSYRVDEELGSLIRSSIIMAGPLLARFGIAEIPTPGGCVLGKRSVMAHLDAFQKVGVAAEYADGYIRFTAPKRPQSAYDIWQFEASVTATENLFLYAAGINSTVKLTDAASEPHVSQLLDIISQMGAKVLGQHSNQVTVSGTTKLGTFVFSPDPDHIDIAGLIVATALTRGNIRILGGNIQNVSGGLIQSFEKFGIQIVKENADLLIDGQGDLKIDLVNSGFPMADEDLPKFVPRPWPGFPVDALPTIVALACKTKGKLLIQNWMYETGLDFIKELNTMGARIVLHDPQRITVNGPVKFIGGKITTPGIIQACMAIFLASLADPVETELTGSEILKRRYPNIFEVYKKLGAKITL
jgi:UDP-N-acetylglucosamine 1-carboxyvinyltransferase